MVKVLQVLRLEQLAEDRLGVAQDTSTAVRLVEHGMLLDRQSLDQVVQLVANGLPYPPRPPK